MRARPRSIPAVCFALFLAHAAPAAAQKDAFVDAYVSLHAALLGAYGDEGADVGKLLTRMSSALEVWEKSVATAESTLKARGASPAEFALLYADARHIDRAIQATKDAIAADPRRASLHVFLGLLQDEAGDAAAATDAFNAAWRLDPADSIAAYLTADRLAERDSDDLMPQLAVLLAAADRGTLSQREPFADFRLVDDLSARRPIFAPAAYARAFASIEKGQFREGLDQFRAAAALDPLVRDAAARNENVVKGIAALRARDGRTAQTELETAVKSLPNSSEAHRLLGVVYRAVGRLPESIEQFTIAVSMAPADERARIALGNALASAGRIDEAERVLRQTIEALPASGEAHWALAEVYQQGEHGINAIAILDDAASLTVVAGKAHLLWRIAELAHGYRRDYSRVVDVLSRRARLIRNQPYAHKDLGLAYSRAGRDDEALVELLVATLLGLSDGEVHLTIGQMHLNAGRLDRAEASLRRAIALDTSIAQAHYSLGLTLQRLGRSVEAKAQLAEFDRLRLAAFDAERRKFESETRPTPTTGDKPAESAR